MQTSSQAGTSGIDVNPEQAAQSVQGMINGFLALLPKIGLGLLVFAIFYLVAWAVKRGVRQASGESGAGKALGRLAQLGILIGGFLVAVTIAFPSVKPADVLGVLGVGGVAIGFAFRDILQNYFAGIILLWREPFKVGDQIETSNGFVGTIQEIETRATIMKTYDGRRVVIPNSNLFTDSVIVNTARDKRRSEYDVGIGYGDDIETARDILLTKLKEVDGVQAEPEPEVLVVALADSTVNLRLRWWTEPDRASVIGAQDRVLTAVKYLLDENGVDMPYPTQVLLLHDQTEETDGDRKRQREGWPLPKEGGAPASARLSQALQDQASAEARQEHPNAG